MSSPNGSNNNRLTLQGIDVPAGQINPAAFFAGTRRKYVNEYNRAFAGLGFTDTVELRKSDIIGGLHVRFTGQLAVTHSAGSVIPTSRWPYDLARAFRFTANGQSNLINCSGLKLKARESMSNIASDDRGVVQHFAAATVQQGTLSMASENWGLGPLQVQAATVNLPVELYWFVPIAEDPKDLAGAIFAQTSSMDLTLAVDWESAANLFTVSGGDTVVLTGNVSVSSEKYSIPVSNGAFVLPDLSMFHSVIQTRVATGVSNGDNELRVIGQGAGKQLLRMFYQIWNGNVPQAPILANATNYGQQGWRYSSNETPELFIDGQQLREWNERMYNCDVGGQWGFLCHEFEVVNAFRDTVDMGQTSELRLLINIANAVTLITPGVEYVQETVFAAGTGA